VPQESVRVPTPVGYADLARVHTDAYLMRLTDGSALAEIFSADAYELQVESVMTSIRLACGATLQGARRAMVELGPVLTTLGGFHHAFPDKGGGLCPVNDIAVAIAALRAEGFSGQVVVLDLDAHPPDGTAACLRNDERVWIGSLSGSDWGPVEGADETVLPEGCDDDTYLLALRGLLSRAPRAHLAFVIAGGDVLAGDRFGRLGLTIDGARRRDLTVLRALGATPSVWMPGGGYSAESWRVLAGTGLALAGYGRREIPADAAPEDLQFDRIARALDRSRLTGRQEDEQDWFGARELEVELGVRRPGPTRLLGTYTTEGLRYAMDSYGLLAQLERLGYADFRFGIDKVPVGERMRAWGRDERGVEHLLAEVVVERRELDERPVLFVHWLTLRHPAGTFGDARPRLPGQEVPGLGLAPEATELLERTARRIGAEGIAMVPSFYHTAWPSNAHVRFVDDAREGRYEALVRDLGHLGRAEVSRALETGRVRLDGEPYAWEATEMVYWLDGRSESEPEVTAERDRVRFTLAEGPLERDV